MNTTVNTVEPQEPIDRDIPDLKVTKKKNNVTRLVVAGGLLVGLIFAAAGITLFMKQLEANKRKEVAEKAQQRPKATQAVATTDFSSAQARIRMEEERAAETEAAAQGQLAMPADAIGVTANPAAASGAAAGGVTGTGQTAHTGGSTTAGQTSAGNSAPRVQTVAERRMDGDVLVKTGGIGSAFGGLGDDGSRRSPAPGGMPGMPNLRQVADAPRNGLDEQVKPSVLQSGAAGQRQDLDLLLHRGTAIPCGTITSIVSEHPGMVMCVVSNDVYSSNGKVLLIERGSKAFGERREVMLQGQARIAALWSRIDTPNGVFVDVNSLATDSMGAAGIPAKVDNHLGERFGGAILLSLISDLGQAAANRASDSRGTIQFGTTATAGDDLASKTLENTINIPPTGYVTQGSATTILVLRDMDFRSVYELARK